MMELHPGFGWWDRCGWCAKNEHTKCCWERCACTCRPRRWLRLKRWVRARTGRRVKTFVIIVALLSTGTARADQRCGAERHAIKVGADTTHALVADKPRPATIAELVALHRPSRLPSTIRMRGTIEVEQLRVTATVKLIRHERDDGDVHLVLADEDGNTMIAEVPDPDCAAGSAWLSQISNARKQTAKLRKGMRVTVTGVGFFDFPHRQSGVAPNAVELHPVLAIKPL